MENTTSKTQIDLDYFPYLKIQQKTISDYHELVDLLNVRKELIRDQWETLSAYDQNNRKITLLKTERELSATHSKISQLQKQLDGFMVALPKNLDEMNENWDWMMESVQRLAKKNKEVAKALASITEDFPISEFETNYEYKLNYYMQIKRLVNPSKNKMRAIHHHDSKESAAEKVEANLESGTNEVFDAYAEN